MLLYVLSAAVFTNMGLANLIKISFLLETNFALRGKVVRNAQKTYFPKKISFQKMLDVHWVGVLLTLAATLVSGQVLSYLSSVASLTTNELRLNFVNC